MKGARSGSAGLSGTEDVAERAMDLVAAVYTATKAFPKEELYGLSAQIRRAAISVPSNIAEGQGRHSTKEFLHHLSIAHGSLLEVETQVLIAERLGLLGQDAVKELMALVGEVGRLINGLANALRSKTEPRR